VPVPLYRPSTDGDDDVLPVQELSHFWEAEAARVKLPWAFRFF